MVGGGHSGEEMKRIDEDHNMDSFAHKARVLDICFIYNKEILLYFMYRCNWSKG